MQIGVHVGRNEASRDIQAELDDLELGHVLLPPQIDFQDGAHIIVVHGDVNKGVEASGGPLIRIRAVQAHNAKQHSHPVVINVQEEELALAEHNQNSIDEFIKFGEVEDVHPEEKGSLVDVLTTRIAEQIFNSLSPSVKIERLGHSITDSQETDDGDGIHVEVVDQRERLGGNSLAVLHEHLKQVNTHQIARTDSKRCPIASQWCHAWFIAELRDVVGHRREELHVSRWCAWDWRFEASLCAFKGRATSIPASAMIMHASAPALPTLASPTPCTHFAFHVLPFTLQTDQRRRLSPPTATPKLHQPSTSASLLQPPAAPARIHQISHSHPLPIQGGYRSVCSGL